MKTAKLSRNEQLGYGLAGIVSILMIAGAALHKLPLDLIEVLGFVTGAWTVWLVVKQRIWNWPVGIANNIFFIILFWDAKLYGDMSLQFVYIIISIFGWYWWLHGGKNNSRLKVSHISMREAIMLVLIGIVATAFMRHHLINSGGAAPLLDATTTVLSLTAQYMLTRKFIENWFVWIVADVIYIYLYFSRDLSLTAVLYGLFLCLCIAGYRQWRRSEHDNAQSAQA